MIISILLKSSESRMSKFEELDQIVSSSTKTLEAQTGSMDASLSASPLSARREPVLLNSLRMLFLLVPCWAVPACGVRDSMSGRFGVRG